MRRQFRASAVWLAALVVAAVCRASAATGQVSSEMGRDEYLDKNYPFIEQEREPPGRFAPDQRINGMLAWQGPSGWRTRHGEATVVWSLGKPLQVQNTLYPDWTRGEARNTLDHGFRRRGGGDRLWIYGRIEVQPSEVAFIDGDQPVYQPPPQGEVPNLEADLARDPAFLTAIKDDRFALAVLNVFENRSFYKGDDTRAWICGLRSSAALVADLRDRGESYQDYYPGHASLAGTYPDDRPDIERRFRTHIEQTLKALADGPKLGVRLEDLMALLGPGHHSAEEVQRATETLRPEAERRRAAETERYRDGQQAQLEKAQRALAAFQEDHTNEDVFNALRDHLSRLGWRVETESDRERIHQRWVERGVRVLQTVKELELRPGRAVEAWVETLRRPSAIGRAFEPGQLERMSPDVRVVENGGLEWRLYQLASTGRIIEQEYRSLAEQLSGPR